VLGKVLDIKGLEKVPEEVVEKSRTIDILLNIAEVVCQVRRSEKLRLMEILDWDEITSLNIHGTYLQVLYLGGDGKVKIRKYYQCFFDGCLSGCYPNTGYSLAKAGVTIHPVVY
jgi:hypothetical protein